ncbi:hypothetical protein NFI96_010443 [Prochilodus magdalenae]|nr:hypothetical protein NFI96_010443 [Prochilodus magdalenae]
MQSICCIWGSRLRVADANRLNKLIRKASDVVGVELDSLMAVSERRTLSKLQTIMDNGSHPLYHTVMRHRSTFSARLIQPKCTTERHRRPLQLVQNAAAHLIFNLPKFTHVTPLLRFRHWLPVVARIRFKTLMLAYKAKNGPAPPYLMAMVKSRAVPQALRASSTARLEPPSLRTHGRQASRLFSVLAPRWWNELRTVESLAVFKRRLKTHLFVMHLRMSTGLGLPGTSTDPLFRKCLSLRVLWSVSCGQRPVTADEGLEDDYQTLQQQMSFRLRLYIYKEEPREAWQGAEASYRREALASLSRGALEY